MRALMCDMHAAGTPASSSIARAAMPASSLPMPASLKKTSAKGTSSANRAELIPPCDAETTIFPWSAASTSVIESTSKTALACTFPVIPCFMFCPASPAEAATCHKFICGRTRKGGIGPILRFGSTMSRHGRMVGNLFPPLRKRVAKFVHRRKQLLGCFTLRPRLEPAGQVGFVGAAHAACMLQG